MIEVMWSSLGRLGHALVARLPYLGIALIVCLAFYIAGRALRGALRATARHTRLDGVLADLLGRLFTIGLTLLGMLIGAVIVFPSFRPGDLLTGLGITSVAIGFAFKDVLCRTCWPASSSSGASPSR
jgi:small conductance mechanosensitive channel